MKKVVFLIIIIIVFGVGCTRMKIAQVDPKTGYFPSSSKATTIKAEKVDLDSMNALILVPNNEFLKGQIINLSYFTEVISFDDLETLIIKNNLQDQIPSIKGKIGLNKAYKLYKPFLWFRFDSRGSGREKYAQFILTNPDTLEDIFIAEQHLDYVWAGVNDQTTWYPLFNSLIDYIKDNSNSYRKP